MYQYIDYVWGVGRKVCGCRANVSEFKLEGEASAASPASNPSS